MSVPDNYDLWVMHEAELERKRRCEHEDESEDVDETE